MPVAEVVEAMGLALMEAAAPAAVALVAMDLEVR
jgi:hypothetical protein